MGQYLSAGWVALPGRGTAPLPCYQRDPRDKKNKKQKTKNKKQKTNILKIIFPTYH